MRPLIGGIIGGFLAVLLIGGTALAVLAVRPRSTPQVDQRNILLQELDAFEQWYDQRAAPWPAYRGQCSVPNQRNPLVTPGIDKPQCRSYYASMQRFLVQHPGLRIYLAWLIDQRLAVAGKDTVGISLAKNPSFADMRDPAMLDRYVATR